jgi:thymidylate synthase (FAD)
MKIVQPSVQLEWITPDALKVIERAGRTCYKSEWAITDDSAPEFIKKIMKRGHLSVIEHASASLRFICDRGVTHEIVRHRLCSYSQESTRYCNYSGNDFGNQVQVVTPPNLSVAQFQEWVSLIQTIQDLYMKWIDEGLSPQIARSILPNCLKTEIVMTCNFREWIHFINLRCAPAAHPQMQEVANMAKAILAKEVPEIFG